MSASTAELIRMRLLKRTVNYFTKCVILLNVVGSQEELVTPSEIHSLLNKYLWLPLTSYYICYYEVHQN